MRKKKLLKKIRHKIYELSPTYKKALHLEERLIRIEKMLVSMCGTNSFLHAVEIKGESFYFYDSPSSNSVDFIASEFQSESNFDFEKIDFKPGDVVIDIGGNIGMVAIYIALKFPFLKIYSFEPAKQNYNNFIKNIKLHNITNVVVENRAVTKDGRIVELMYDAVNTGSSTMTKDMHKAHALTNILKIEEVESITLDQIFEKYGLKQCKLLKIDCEGAEYEILYNTKVLGKIENIRGEVHDCDRETKNGDALISHCKQFIAHNKIKLAVCRL
ncbi:MAG: FkbM family methyltransferase [Desulfobacula sp.]|nr:FkbM family methyltransferase [Desulfobacula sp.]